jgi:hypothetical protein
MAYKTFANGFPLPASDLNNFLMNQSVIVFADAAARTTAIPTPIQGMLTYLVDTSAYESWNGSAFVGISNPGDITAVTAGTGLTGGGTTGDVTLNLDAAAVIPSSTVTTSQDLIVADGASSVTRLGVGTDDQVLSVVAGEVAWADAGGGGGWTLLSTTSLVGVDSVDITSISQDYKDLRIVGIGISHPNTNTRLRLRINNTATQTLIIESGTLNRVENFNSQLSNSGFPGISPAEMYFTAFIYDYTVAKRQTGAYTLVGDNTFNSAMGMLFNINKAAVTQIVIDDNGASSSFTHGSIEIYGAN